MRGEGVDWNEAAWRSTSIQAQSVLHFATFRCFSNFLTLPHLFSPSPLLALVITMTPPTSTPGNDGASSSSSSSPSRTLRVLLIRHGETDHNVAGIIQGQLDTPLNSRGRAQAALLGQALKQEQIDVVYSSPLQRASDVSICAPVLLPMSPTLLTQLYLLLNQTAAAIIHARPQPHLPIRADDRLKERAFGSLEGRRFTGTKRDSVPGIERSTDLQERLADFWRYLVREHATAKSEKRQETTTALVVAHGASLSSLLGCISEYAVREEGVSPSRLWNCSITELLVPLEFTLAAAAEVQASHLLEDVRALDEARVTRDATPEALALAQKERDEAYKERARRSGIVIARWADVKHLEDEEPLGAAKTKGSAEAKATRTGVSKAANADEVSA